MQVSHELLVTCVERVCSILEPLQSEIEQYERVRYAVLPLLKEAMPKADFMMYGSYSRGTFLSSRVAPCVDFDVLAIVPALAVDEVVRQLVMHGPGPLPGSDWKPPVLESLQSMGCLDAHNSEPSICFTFQGLQVELTRVQSFDDYKNDLENATFMVQWPMDARDISNPELRYSYCDNATMTPGGEEEKEGTPVFGWVSPLVLNRASVWCDSVYVRMDWLQLVRLLKYWNKRSGANLVSYELEFEVFRYLTEQSGKVMACGSIVDLLISFVCRPEVSDIGVFALSPEFSRLHRHLQLVRQAALRGEIQRSFVHFFEVVPLPFAPEFFWLGIIPDREACRSFCLQMLAVSREEDLTGQGFAFGGELSQRRHLHLIK